MSESSAIRWSAPDFKPRTTVNTAVEASTEQAATEPLRLGPSVEELAAIEKAAHDEGFAAGHAEGLAAGQAEISRLRSELSTLLHALRRPLADLDQEVAEVLGQLAVTIAGELLREAYQADPARLARLVEQVLAELAIEERDGEVLLHPADLTLLQADTSLASLRLRADPSLSRGSVRVVSPHLRIDGGLETRLQSALAALRAAPAEPESAAEPAA